MKKFNPFKRFVSVSAAAATILCSLNIAPVSIFEADAADVMKPFEITQNMKIGWNLGNTLDATASNINGELASAGLETETCWGNPKTTQELIDAVKAKGFNTVRVPTTWFQHLDENNKIDPAWMARVKEVVDYCIKDDMYVILNVHHENWVNRADLGTAYDEMHTKLMAIWQQIGTEFANYDQHLIFECMNEPRAKGTTHEWWGPLDSEVDTINKLNADFVELIRSIDSPYKDTRLLMIPDYCASADKSIYSKLVVPDDDYVAVSIHAYSPYNFTMNNGEGGYHETFTGSFQTELEGILQSLRDTFIEKDIPVIIGEFGSSNFDNLDARIAWADTYLTNAKKYGIPCVLWDNNTISNPKDPGECHGYLNRANLSWYSESVGVVDKMMSVLADDSIEWGSEGHKPEVSHKDLSEGTVVLQGPEEIDASKGTEAAGYKNSTPSKDITWAALEGNEVAVKYTGTLPVVAVSNSEWGDWSEVSAYDVDEANGIAYYAASQIAKAWKGSDLSEIAHLQCRTDGVTTIESISILGAGEIVIEIPEDKTKKYPVEFMDAVAEDTLIIGFNGEPGTVTNGCLGFMADEWTTVEWNGTLNENGNLTVMIPVSEFPESVRSAELQIWYNPELVEMNYFGIQRASEASTMPTTTTTYDTQTTTTTGEITGTLPEWYGLGDVDESGEITVSDIVSVLQYCVNKTKYDFNNAECLRRADVNGDGDVTADDAFIIQQVDAKLIDRMDLPYRK